MKSPITLQIYKRILLGNLSRNRRTNNTGSCHWKLLLKFSTSLFFTSSFDAGSKITKCGCTNLKNTTVTTRILTTKTKTKIQIFHILIIWSLEKLPPIWYLCKGNRDTDKFEDLRQSVILLQQKILDSIIQLYTASYITKPFVRKVFKTLAQWLVIFNFFSHLSREQPKTPALKRANIVILTVCVYLHLA